MTSPIKHNPHEYYFNDTPFSSDPNEQPPQLKNHNEDGFLIWTHDQFSNFGLSEAFWVLLQQNPKLSLYPGTYLKAGPDEGFVVFEDLTSDNTTDDAIEEIYYNALTASLSPLQKQIFAPEVNRLLSLTLKTCGVTPKNLFNPHHLTFELSCEEILNSSGRVYATHTDSREVVELKLNEATLTLLQTRAKTSELALLFYSIHFEDLETPTLVSRHALVSDTFLGMTQTSDVFFISTKDQAVQIVSAGQTQKPSFRNTLLHFGWTVLSALVAGRAVRPVPKLEPAPKVLTPLVSTRTIDVDAAPAKHSTSQQSFTTSTSSGSAAPSSGGLDMAASRLITRIITSPVTPQTITQRGQYPYLLPQTSRSQYPIVVDLTSTLNRLQTPLETSAQVYSVPYPLPLPSPLALPSIVSNIAFDAPGLLKDDYFIDPKTDAEQVIFDLPVPVTGEFIGDEPLSPEDLAIFAAQSHLLTRILSVDPSHFTPPELQPGELKDAIEDLMGRLENNQGIRRGRKTKSQETLESDILDSLAVFKPKEFTKIFWELILENCVNRWLLTSNSKDSLPSSTWVAIKNTEQGCKLLAQNIAYKAFELIKAGVSLSLVPTALVRHKKNDVIYVFKNYPKALAKSALKTDNILESAQKIDAAQKAARNYCEENGLARIAGTVASLVANRGIQNTDEAIELTKSLLAAYDAAKTYCESQNASSIARTVASTTISRGITSVDAAADFAKATLITYNQLKEYCQNLTTDGKLANTIAMRTTFFQATTFEERKIIAFNIYMSYLSANEYFNDNSASEIADSAAYAIANRGLQDETEAKNMAKRILEAHLAAKIYCEQNGAPEIAQSVATNIANRGIQGADAGRAMAEKWLESMEAKRAASLYGSMPWSTALALTLAAEPEETNEPEE